MSSAAQALREKQKPIKDAYRSNPSAAVVTLKSTGSLDDTSLTCKLETGKAVKEAQRIAGLHPKAGGPDPVASGELCSGDLLLDALVACAGVTLKAVATNLGFPLESGTITAEGDLDFKGTLGVDKSAPVGMTNIRLNYDLKFGTKENGETVTASELELLGKYTERYCVVLQTLVKKPELRCQFIGHIEKEGTAEELRWSQSA
jgi:uncharacterized OsmC-like protein